MSTSILQGIIEFVKKDKFQEAQEECGFLPQVIEVINLYAMIGAIDAQSTEQAYSGTKSAAIRMADKLIGRI